MSCSARGSCGPLRRRTSAKSWKSSKRGYGSSGRRGSSEPPGRAPEAPRLTHPLPRNNTRPCPAACRAFIVCSRGPAARGAGPQGAWVRGWGLLFRRKLSAPGS